jgi:TonB family protein
MKKRILSIASTIVLGFSIASAQTETPIKPINGGVLNGKATSLAKPVYSAAARAVKAEGAVSVQVVIDEEGNIASATAVSGHPLLRQAAQQAALQSKFSPTLLSGQPVKISGIVVYNFVADGNFARSTGNWVSTGRLLSNLDNAPTLRYFDVNTLTMMIPTEWTAERQQIARLDELKKAEMEMPGSADPKERVINETTMKTGDKDSIKTTITTVTVLPERKNTSEATALGQSLISSIQGRLAGNALDLWNFNLGINTNKALLNADSRSENERLKSVKPFREIIKNAPAEISQEFIAELEKMALMMEKGIFTDADKVAFSQSLTKIDTMPRN